MIVDVNVFPHRKPAQFCRERQRRSIRRLVPVSLTSGLSFFDVPADARNPRLLVSDVDPVSASSGPSRKQPAARKNLSGTKPKRSRYAVRLAVNPLFSAPWFHHIATNLP
jgi:hypothetical protein